MSLTPGSVTPDMLFHEGSSDRLYDEVMRLAKFVREAKLPPTVLLDEVRDFYDCTDRLAGLVQELDAWIATGGTLPTAWRNEVTEGSCTE